MTVAQDPPDVLPPDHQPPGVTCRTATARPIHIPGSIQPHGLNFPASDIPAQARELYIRNPSRNIPDAAFTPSPLVPAADPRTGKPIDLSLAALRSVSPIHVEYLSHMEMRASMSGSIIRDGELWGLISCVNRRPTFTGYEVRQACELIARALAWQIGVLEEVEAVRHGLRLKTLQTRLALDMGISSDAHEVLALHSPALLEAVNASGAALWVAGRLTPVGQTPAEEHPGSGLMRRSPVYAQTPRAASAASRSGHLGNGVS